MLYFDTLAPFRVICCPVLQRGMVDLYHASRVILNHCHPFLAFTGGALLSEIGPDNTMTLPPRRVLYFALTSSIFFAFILLPFLFCILSVTGFDSDASN